VTVDPQPDARSATTAAAPVLVVDDLRLVPFTDQDAADLADAVRGDAEVARYSSLRRVHDEGTALRWMASRRRVGQIDWAVRDADGRLVGRTALHDVDLEDGVGEVGYTVFAAYRRQGIASRVTGAVTTYGFEELGLARIVLMHAVANHASCRVARHCGFALEGQLRAALPHAAGGHEDAHLHARLAGDLPGPIAGPAPLAPVELPAEGLRLIPWHEEHAPFLLAAAENPELVRWNPLRHASGPIRTLEDARIWARSRADWSGGEPCWAVCEPDKTPLGYLSLHSLDRAEQLTGQLGYWTAPQARGRGVASRAVRAGAHFGFDAVGLHRLEIFHAVVNPGSCRVAEACGFAFEGVQRMGYRYPEGEFHDEHRHARLAED
jgi:RimJ/RimL family protein N-acetyltransferase